jgi:hypothetical protein
MSDEYLEQAEGYLAQPPMGWPMQYWDPTEYEWRFGKLALGRFTVSNISTYIYERFISASHVRPAGQKTFLVIPMGGIEGSLIDAQPEWGPGEFNHERYQTILRRGSLRNWWASNTTDSVNAQFLFTKEDGTYLGLEYLQSVVY